MGQWHLENPTIEELKAKLAEPGVIVTQTHVEIDIKGAEKAGALNGWDTYSKEKFRAYLKSIMSDGETLTIEVSGATRGIWPWKVEVVVTRDNGELTIVENGALGFMLAWLIVKPMVALRYLLTWNNEESKKDIANGIHGLAWANIFKKKDENKVDQTEG